MRSLLDILWSFTDFGTYSIPSNPTFLLLLFDQYLQRYYFNIFSFQLYQFLLNVRNWVICEIINLNQKKEKIMKNNLHVFFSFSSYTSSLSNLQFEIKKSTKFYYFGLVTGNYSYLFIHFDYPGLVTLLHDDSDIH